MCIALSVFHRFTDSDYLFGIFIHFLEQAVLNDANYIINFGYIAIFLSLFHVKRCLCLWIFHHWLYLRFSIKFVYFSWARAKEPHLRENTAHAFILLCFSYFVDEPAAPAYGVYISPFIRYSRTCGSYRDILDIGLLLTRKLLNQGFILVKLKLHFEILRSPPWHGWPLWDICVTNDHGYIPFVVNTSSSFPHSWLITGFVTRLTRRVLLVEQEIPTFPEHLNSPPVFSGVHVTRSLVLCHVCFVDRCLYFCSFGHCVVCPSSIYGFWLPLWYLQTLLINVFFYHIYS
jgi:hypothetical protein